MDSTKKTRSLSRLCFFNEENKKKRDLPESRFFLMFIFPRTFHVPKNEMHLLLQRYRHCHFHEQRSRLLKQHTFYG